MKIERWKRSDEIAYKLKINNTKTLRNAMERYRELIRKLVREGDIFVHRLSLSLRLINYV